MFGNINLFMDLERNNSLSTNTGSNTRRRRVVSAHNLTTLNSRTTQMITQSTCTVVTTSKLRTKSTAYVHNCSQSASHSRSVRVLLLSSSSNNTKERRYSYSKQIIKLIILVIVYKFQICIDAEILSSSTTKDMEGIFLFVISFVVPVHIFIL